MTLCLNMIVKNEGHIIKETLTKLLLKVKFDYYVICDTGSTDDTINIIKQFFYEMSIPGEIHLHMWKDFGYNRTLALEAAYKKTDYLLVFDADDSIEGNFILPDLTLDGYTLKFGENNSSYERMCLIKNNLKWKYNGVLHEYLSCETSISEGKILGDYYIISGRTSSRNNDPKKYIKDAEILEKGYYESLKNGDNLHNRYVYYCANSYNDAGMKEKAIEWYKKTLISVGWFDERYNSCLKLYELTGNKDYLVESYHHNPRRIEAICSLVRHYTCEGMYSIAMCYYNFIKNYFENEWDNLSTKLFSNVLDYTFYLPYYMIIVCEKMKDYSTGVKMYSIIFDKKAIVTQWWYNNLFFNLQFFEGEESYKLLKIEEYISFVEKHGIEVKRKNIILKQEDQDQDQEIDKKDKKYYDILIYVGFSEIPWNYTYSLTNAMGGSERAIVYLSQLFPKQYKILITGDVKEEIINNITYLNRFNLNKSYEFGTIIVSRYASFFTMYSYLKCKKLIMMAHDTYFINNLTGCNKSSNEIIKNNINRIDSIVYLTEWQKNHYQTDKHPELKDKEYSIINNGIQLNLFPQYPKQKIKNSFIYTSGSFRGLKRLLEIWEYITLPGATLSIASYENFPKSDDDRLMNEIIIKNDSIQHLGKLNQNELYNLMEISEYWLYPCSFHETSCITALEMLMSEVICLYYPIAGLTDTLGNYGIQVKHGNEVETILNLTDQEKENIKRKGKEYAKNSSWDHRIISWNKIIYKKRLLFYATVDFPKIVLDDYINSLRSIYEIKYTTKIEENDHIYYDELIYIHEVRDKTQIDKFKEVSYLNTEPMNLAPRLDYIKFHILGLNLKFYDYSLSNIKIFEDQGIKNIHHLPYLFTEEENEYLKDLNERTPKEYDFGIIGAATDKIKDINYFSPPRRNKIVRTLLSNGFTVNMILGFGKERDTELAKCKTILNIHGQFSKLPTTIFEHIRCNRLLDAGFKILSEESEFMDFSFCNKYPNLQFKNYNDILNMKKSNVKIIDCFTFYNEVQMLEYRLKTLYDTVDYFVLSEATLTHVGKPKEMYFDKNKFKVYADKIIHVIDNDFPFNEHNIDTSKNEQWKNEKHQRNYIINGLAQLDLNKDDIIIVSDVDEIPDPVTLEKIKYNEVKLNDVAQLEQGFYYYNLESKMDHLWYFSKIFRWQWFLMNDFKLDDVRMGAWITIKKGGWHLSYFGNSSFISNKIKNFAHQEYNSNDYTDLNIIQTRIDNGIDIYNRNIQIIKIPIENNDYLPPLNSFPFLPNENNKKVFISTSCPMGLGNCLFVVAAGIYYAEKYNYTLVLNKNDNFLQNGTANMFNRKKLNESYFENIFKNISKQKLPNQYKTVYNDYTDCKIIPTNNENIHIKGYNQNLSLFIEVKDKLLNYLYLDDPIKQEYIKEKYIKQKYNLNKCINVFIGLRLDTDGGFKYSNLTYQSYKKVMDNIISENPGNDVHFFIISDVDPTKFLINNTYPVTVVEETDINQFYFGFECSHFILSESTYHYWIALLVSIKKKIKVYAFEDTDIMRNNKNFIKGFDWEIVEQTEDQFDFYKNVDQSGYDISYNKLSVPILKEITLKNKEAICFNTIGFIKNKIEKLNDFSSFGPNEGTYIKNENAKKYIFIHSCNVYGTSMLEYLLEKVLHLNGITKIFVNNVGPPITTTFENELIEVTNYSENAGLFEIPTINKIKQFSMDNPNNYILYLHTKGVSYNYKNEYVNDWTNMMLYFLLKPKNIRLIHYYDTIGCNYHDPVIDNSGDNSGHKSGDVPAHWSGNFWWARTNYLKDLPFLDTVTINKYSSEMWLFQNNPQYYELHGSPVNHYKERYPLERYQL